MTTEMIAREGERAVLEAFLDRPAAGLRALVLEGEAGIGKSTLWLAGVEAARERSLSVLVSRPAEAERTLPNVVLGDLFGDVAPEVLAALPAPRRRVFESALLLQEAPDVSVDPRALGVAILTLVPALGVRGRLVLAIDDDQWMDTSSAATLLFALRRLADQPISLLLARLTTGAPAAGLEAAIDPSDVEHLAVAPLSLGSVHLLLRRRLGMAFPRPILMRIYEVSGGNPFYALELARALSERPAHDATLPLAVPPSLGLLVGARLRALEPETRSALLLIAAQGRLPLEMLRALDVNPAALDGADAANVIEITGDVIHFTHPLLASALYQGATQEQRRDAHSRLAMVLDDPVDRGRHLARTAREPSAELAAELESAAAVAGARGIPIAAAELAEHALRLTPPEAPDDRHRRAIATARALAAAGEGGRARKIAKELRAGAPGGRRRAEALVLQADLGPPDIGLSLLGDALAEAAGIPDLEAAIHAGLAEAGFYSASKESGWGERHARAALRLAERLDKDELRANALWVLAILRFDACDPHALELAERAYRLAAPLTDPRQLTRAGLAVGHMLTWIGRTDAAREWLQHLLADWSDRDERVRSDLLWYLALVELWAGRWNLASDYAEQARDINAQFGVVAPQDSWPSALVALHRGQFEIARQQSRDAMSIGRRALYDWYLAILAICDLWSGDPEAAVPTFILAEQAADGLGSHDPSLRGWRAEYVEALLQLGRVDDAARLTDEWESTARALARERVLAHAVRCRGLIAAARGELPAAVDLLEEAVGRHEAVGDPFGHARALLDLGAVRRRMRQKRTARAAIETALATFEELGAQSWVTAARRERARIGGRQRIEGLSPSELDVATLVAEGRTNREIASALFLGERTVAGHLTHIYSKLGVRSRTELARTLRVPSISGVDATNIERS